MKISVSILQEFKRYIGKIMSRQHAICIAHRDYCLFLFVMMLFTIGFYLSCSKGLITCFSWNFSLCQHMIHLNYFFKMSGPTLLQFLCFFIGFFFPLLKC